MNRMSLIGAALVAMAGALTAAAQETRVATVDMDAIFSDYDKTKDADLKLRDQAAEFNDEREELVSEYETLEEEFKELREESQNEVLSEEVRAERRDAAEAKLVEMRELKSKLRRFDTTRRKQLEGQMLRMREGIVEEITDIIKGYARDEGYDLVLDSSGKSANGIPVVIYQDAKHDLTDAILERLNEER